MLARQNFLVKIKDRDDLALFFSFLAGLQQGAAVVEGETNQLLAPRDNLLVAQGAGFTQGQIVVFGMFHQVHNTLKLLTGFRGLAIEALGQNHGQ